MAKAKVSKRKNYGKAKVSMRYNNVKPPVKAPAKAPAKTPAKPSTPSKDPAPIVITPPKVPVKPDPPKVPVKPDPPKDPVKPDPPKDPVKPDPPKDPVKPDPVVAPTTPTAPKSPSKPDTKPGGGDAKDVGKKGEDNKSFLGADLYSGGGRWGLPSHQAFQDPWGFSMDDFSWNWEDVPAEYRDLPKSMITYLMNKRKGEDKRKKKKKKKRQDLTIKRA